MELIDIEHVRVMGIEHEGISGIEHVRVVKCVRARVMDIGLVIFARQMDPLIYTHNHADLVLCILSS